MSAWSRTKHYPLAPLTTTSQHFDNSTCSARTCESRWLCVLMRRQEIIPWANINSPVIWWTCQALHSSRAVPPPIMPLALLDSWRTASKMLSEMMAKSVRQLGRTQNLSWWKFWNYIHQLAYIKMMKLWDTKHTQSQAAFQVQKVLEDLKLWNQLWQMVAVQLPVMQSPTRGLKGRTSTTTTSIT